MAANNQTAAGKKLITIGDRLFNAKQNYDQLNQEIATWFYPHRADFTQTLILGEEFADHITDSTPLRMLRDLGNAMGTMMRPQGQQWFKIVPFDPGLKDDIEVQRKLQQMTQLTHNLLYARAGKFKRAAKEADFDFACFGCSIMSLTLNRARNGFNYRTWHLRDCAWMENDDGDVDYVHRKISSTARGLAEKFPANVLPEEVQRALDSGEYDRKFEIRHIALPIQLYEPTRKFPKGAQYASVYVAKDGSILEEQPEYEFPYIVSRWQTVSNWNYGFSPATLIALPDARLIERMSLTIIESSEKATDPPLIATSEAINGPIDISSGAVTWVDAEYDERLGQPLRPLDLGKNVGVGERLLDQRTLDMAQTFFLDKLNLPEGGRKTAYETSQLVQEYIRNALPLFEPMEDEVTGQQLNLTVDKALRLGVYGPPEQFPEALQGSDVQFEFSNPLKEARDRQVINSFGETAQVMTTVSQLDQTGTAVKRVNIPKMAEAVMRITGDPEWLYTDDELAEQATQEQQGQEGQEALDNVQRISEVAQSAAGAGSALTQLINQQEQ